ncbi:phage tail-collar fiber domain-containing protein [Pseudomonas siliginis]|jgi:phage-related tail fiber protein|uniref:phage tail-collar fiber domain-containing protein n=1 Tax=Pseudomonas siliginis TaxID=2842346 RepID=UPI002092DBF8|nr:phage tail protein [Pseudomonas siliginis]USU01789.1 phage tail protein [Pseudomonas siliginis]
MADYYTLLTNAGIAYETACKAAGTPIKLTQISVGDGNGAVYNPAATATALKREVWRGPLNALFQDEKNPSWLLAEVTIPPDVGGWYVREAGLWTDTGILYAIVKYPESFKPVLATSGSGKEFYIRSIFETSNASLVTLLIDDTVVKATRAWVMSYLAEELGKLDGKQSVRVAATGNVVLNSAQQIDGVAVIAGDRVLLPSQTLAKDNGLWIVANGDWVRATDANTSAKVTPGLTVMVEEGTANGDSLWHLSTNAPITLGTTALTFKMLAGRTGIAAGTYKSLTVDEYGRATAGANPETLAGFGIKDSYTKAEVEALIAKASALPVGSIVAFPVDAPPPGFLELDNSVKSSATYPDLSAYLGGKFNKGDEGVGNFRLPEARGEFLRGWDHGRGVDASRGVGSAQLDSLQNITGQYAANNGVQLAAVGQVGGAFGSAATGGTQIPGGGAATGVINMLFDASRVARTSTETRPRNIAVMWCIKAWNAPVNQGAIDVAALAKEVERLKSAVPVGAVLAFPTGIVAPGYLELDGSAQSIATYPDLAAFLGTTYNKGDEGAGNFRLPESRGEFLRGWDHGRGVDADRTVGSWQNHQFQSHLHALRHTVTTAAGAGSGLAVVISGAGTGANSDIPITGNVGAETRPRNLAVMWCIKAWNAPINQGNIDIGALLLETQRLRLNGPLAGASRNAALIVNTASLTATFTADEVIVEDFAGSYRLNNFNKLVNLSVVGVGGMDAGVAPSNGYVGLYAIYNPASGVSALMAVNAVNSVLPNVYSGINIPAGFTASALVSILPTQSAGLFAACQQDGRHVDVSGISVLNTTVLSGPTTQVVPALPKNARMIGGSSTVTSTTAGSISLSLFASDASVGQKTNNGTVPAGGQQTVPFERLHMKTPQTIRWATSTLQGSPTFIVSATSYDF